MEQADEAEHIAERGACTSWTAAWLALKMQAPVELDHKPKMAERMKCMWHQLLLQMPKGAV